MNDDSKHLTEYDLASYLDGTLPPEAEQRVQAHAASTPEDAAALADAVRLLDAVDDAKNVPVLTAEARRRAAALGAGASLKPWYARRAVQATLASVTLLVLVIGWWQPWIEPEMTFRAAPSANGFSATIPSDGAVIVALPIQFAWHEVSEARRYRVDVFTEAGEAVWQADVAVTDLQWQPEPGRLAAGETYFWRVQAVRGDGTLLDTDLYLFRYAVE
ncbi:MAG: hypothetical protein AAF730_06905 [Bacteroidota bacterium]